MNYLDEQGLNTYDTLIKSYVRGVMSERSEIPSSLMAVINGIDSKVDVVDGNIDTILSNYVTKTDLQDALAGISSGSVSERDPQAVDLGLPSGLLWADRNVGAISVNMLGLYFSWANIDGHTSDYGFGEGNYQLSNGYKRGSSFPSGDPRYDAARANMGGDWRIPKPAEWQELIDNCTWTYSYIDGVSGYTVKGPNNNTIFLPASGYRQNSLLHNTYYGYYWSTDYLSSSYAYYLAFEGDSKRVSNGGNRYSGYSVRAVRTSS